MTRPAPVLAGHGISVRLPDGWEGRIFRRGADAVKATPAPTHPPPPNLPRPAPHATSRAPVAVAERTHPVMHLANFALPPDRGDFGSGAVDRMGPRNLLIVLFEFGADSVGTALFRPQGMPRPRLAEFHPDTLQRRLPDQLGYQRFFTLSGRAFTLYIVLGSVTHGARLSATAREVTSAITIAHPVGTR
jgi:hypothetical protein